MLPGRDEVSDSAAYTHEEGAVIRIDMRKAPLQIGEDGNDTSINGKLPGLGIGTRWGKDRIAQKELELLLHSPFPRVVGLQYPPGLVVFSGQWLSSLRRILVVIGIYPFAIFQYREEYEE